MLQDVIDTLRANGGYVPDVVEGDNKRLTPSLGIYQPEADINMWSRRKPVINKKANVLTTAEMATSGIGDTAFTNGTARYGITIVGGAAVTPADIYKGVKWYGAGAMYFLPTGGEDKEPYRLSDFNGYYPAATEPLRGSLSGVITIDPLLGSDNTEFDFFVRTTGSDSDSLSFADLYPTDGVDGNTITWRTGVVLVNKANEDDVRVVLDAFDADFTNANKGKTFYGVQFLTSTTATSASTALWQRSVQYAMPGKMFELTVRNTSSGGNTGAQNLISIFVATGYPKFSGITTDPTTRVTTKFTLKIRGGTGKVEKFTAGIYPSSACALDERISVVNYADQTINTEKTFTANFDNPNKIADLWVGIRFNDNLQHVAKVAMPRQERPTAI
jgi:hypothetical protein